MSPSRITQTRFLSLISIAVTATFATTFLTTVSPSHAEEQATPVVGSFALGGSVTAGVDERSGVFTAQVPVAALPGIDGGGVNVGLSYSQDTASHGGNSDGTGIGWSWGVPRVLTDSGVQVVTPSGEVYSASQNPGGIGEGQDSTEVGSGLEGYVQDDLVFSQTVNTFLDPRNRVGDPVPYAYTLEHLGGVTDYFGVDGLLLARIDAYEYRSDWKWDGDRLIGVTDTAGSTIVVNWSDTNVTITSPPRSDGEVAYTVLEIAGNQLISITDPVGEKIQLEYNDSGLLEHVEASTGARTEITYQPLPNNHVANGAKTVHEVRTVDSDTGEVLLKRAWNVKGSHNPQGSPTYSSAAEMWAAGDGSYRYETVLTDGDTSIESVYNSMGLMLSRTVIVSTTDGEYTAQEQAFTYPDTEHGGVPNKDQIPQQYAKPTTTTVTHRDNKGGTRRVTEKTEFDKTGRIVEHTTADESVTTTEYDTQKPVGPAKNRSSNKLPYGLVTKQTTTGNVGTIAETIHTLTSDRKAVQTTETRIAVPGGELERTSRTEYTVDADGFVTEQKTIAVGEVTEGPPSVITHFERVIDTDAKTITASQTDAAETNAESTTSTITDLVTGLQLTAIDPTGRVSTSTYDRGGRILTQTAPGDLHTATEYETKLTRVTDPTGITTSERVDALGRVVEITDNITTRDGVHIPDPNTKRIIETREYEHNGSTITVTDARGLKTTTITDTFGRPLSVKGPSGVQQIKAYDDVANTVTSGLVGPSGSGLNDALQITTSESDSNDRHITTTSARKDGVRVPEQGTTYDGLGRVAAQTGGDTSTNFVLNPDGTPKTLTVTPTNPGAFQGEPVVTDRTHDLMGVSTKKTVTRGGVSREGVIRVLDAGGRTISQTDQVGNTTQYTYTPDGLVATVHEYATGVITRNTYDETTRLLTDTTSTTPVGGVSGTHYEHDPVTGNLLGVCDPTQCEQTRVGYTYDIFGNTTSTIYPDGKTIDHVFDEHNKHTSTTDTVGNTTHYVYDRIGLLNKVTQTSPDGTQIAQIGYAYDEFGRITTLTGDNNTTTTYTFTSANEILTETTTHTNGTLIHASEYTYDAHGNLTQRVDTQPEDMQPGEGTVGEVTETTTHKYNAYDQLVESRIYSGNLDQQPEGHLEPSQVTSYEIGVTGEVTTETTTNTNQATTSVTGPTSDDPATSNETTTSRVFEYNALGQTTAITTHHNSDPAGVRVEQTYDPAGNLTRATDGTTYTYNVYNQPVTETHPTNGSHHEHTYWVTGQRNTITTTNTNEVSGAPNAGETSQAESTTSVGFYWDGATLANDTHTHTHTHEIASQVTGSYLIGISRHTRTLTTDGTNTAPANVQYYVTDRHGNTTATTNTAGTIVSAYTYSDYGVTTEHTTPNNPAGNTLTTQDTPTQSTTTPDTTLGTVNPFRYAGEYTTADDRQLLNKRTYDPTVFGFTTRDDANQFNLYAYANSNPITLIDPTGQTATSDWDTIHGGIMIGVSVITMFFAAATVGMAVALGAWLAVGIGIAANVAEITATGIAAAQLVDKHSSDFISDEASETLSWVAWGFTIAGVVLGSLAGGMVASATANLGKNAAFEMETITNFKPASNLDDIGGSALLAERGQKMPAGKNGIKKYFHGTASRHVESILAEVKVLSTSKNGRSFGDGFYVTRNQALAWQFSDQGAGIKMTMDAPARAAKIFKKSDGLWAIKNPRYSSKWYKNIGESYELKNSPQWGTPARATNDLAEKYGVQAVQIGKADTTVVTKHGVSLIKNREAW